MLILVDIHLTTCLKKLTTTYGSMSAVLSPMKALVTLAIMLELLRGRPSARYTFTQKRAQGRSEGKPSGISRFLKKRTLQQHLNILKPNQNSFIQPFEQPSYQQQLERKFHQESKAPLTLNSKTLQYSSNPTSNYKISHVQTCYADLTMAHDHSSEDASSEEHDYVNSCRQPTGL